MRRIAWLAAPLVALAGCEVLVGIQDKSAVEDPSAPCAQQPSYLFCDDFDSDPEAGANWQWDTPQGGASIEMDPTEFKTPPRSVRILAPPDAPQAQLGRPVGTLTSGFRVAFDLRVDMSDLGPIAQVGVGQVLATGADVMINYVLGPGSACGVQVWDTQGNTALLDQAVPPPPLQTWTRIVLAYDATQGLTVLQDGTPLLSDTSVARGAPGDTTVIVGAVYVNPPGSAPLQIEIDDVVVRGH